MFKVILVLIVALVAATAFSTLGQRVTRNVSS